LSEYIATENMTIKFDDDAHSGTITIVTPASTTVKADSGAVHKDLMAVSITGGSDGSITNATGAGVINATSEKVKVDNLFVLRKDDKNDIPIVMTGTNPAPPPPTSTYTTDIYIDDPGNTKVKAE